MAMAEEEDQAKPFAAKTDWIDPGLDQEDRKEPSFLSRHHRKCIICCGCCAALLLIPMVVGLILMFTVFRVKDPVLRVDHVKIEGLLGSRPVNSSSLRGVNMTVEVMLTVKNPNFSSLMFRNATTSVYYGTSVIGECTLNDGRLEARKTIQMNVTVDVAGDKVSEVGRFENDWEGGALPMSMITGLKGKVRILKAMRRSVLVGIICNMTWNVSSGVIQDRTCKNRV